MRRMMGYLPHDLIIEILSRLPVKVLCKFRCVSKSWLELLTSNREFLARQAEMSKQTPLFLIRRYLIDGTEELHNTKITIELTSLDIQGYETDKFKKVIDGPVHTFISCGSLCVLCCKYSLYLCNPCTRQLVRVPYHGRSKLCNIGFGFLPATNEYKIVNLFPQSNSPNGKMGCEIFSFKRGEDVTSGSWKQIQDFPFNAWADEYPVCVNGVIYWSISSGWKEKSIVSLDLKKEEFTIISYPIHHSKKYSFLEYTGLMGSFCVVGFSAETSTMDVWMLINSSKIWVIQCSINLFPLRPKLLLCTDDCSEKVVVHMEQRDLISYSLKSKQSTRVGYYKDMKNYNKPCLYYGSLVPLHS